MKASTVRAILLSSRTVVETAWGSGDAHARGLLSAFWERGSPDLPACGPRRGCSSRPVRPIFIIKAFKTLARGQASRGGQHKTSSGAASPGWLTRGREIKARQTSRGSRDVRHDDRDQVGASAQCPCFPFGAKGASAGEEYRGIKQRFPYWCNETKTRRTARRRSPWSPGRRHHQSLLAGEDRFCQDKLH